MRFRVVGALCCAALMVLVVPASFAVGYASAVTPQGGGNYSFTLNETANVAVYRTGDSPLMLGTLAPGSHTFNVGAGSGFEIRVGTSTPVGWTQLIADSYANNFYSPAGVSINKNPASPNFGKMYISNAVAGTCAAGRVSSDGIYVVGADMADLGFTTGGRTWTGSSSPWKSTIGPDDKLYVVDYGIDTPFEFSSDLSAATALMDASNKQTFTYGGTNYTQYVAGIQVTGTQAAGNRVLYTVDANYYNGNPGRKGVIAYSLGGNAAATPGDLGTQFIGPDYYTFFPYDGVRDSAGNWYVTQYRYDPAQAPAISKFLDGPPPINTAAWETPKTAPYNGAYGIDVYEPEGWVAYGNYYDGWVHIFDTDDGSYVGGFDAGSRVREVAFDAAGNLVTVDNLVERTRVWTPGGDFLTITTSDGQFFRVPEPATLALLALGLLITRRR